MAEGGNISLREDRLRKTTLDMRKERQLLEQEKEEEILRRIQERNRNEEVLADFRNQREELIKSRTREKENSQELSYTIPRKEKDSLRKRRLTDGDIGTNRLESVDLSLEALRLDEKLTQLENSVMSDRNTLLDNGIKEHTDRRDSRLAHENIIDRLSTIMDRDDRYPIERNRRKEIESRERLFTDGGSQRNENEKEVTDNSLFRRDDRYPIERNRRKEIESRERLFTDGGSQRNELEESIRVLEEDVELKEKNTIFDDRQHIIDMKQEQFVKWTNVLEAKEIEIQRKSNDLVKREILFEKELKEKSLQFKVQENRLIELQQKIEQKYENFERTVRNREERLNIDMEQTYRKREILIEEEFRKKIEEIEERINDNWSRKFQEREILLEELSRRLREKEDMEHDAYRRYSERNEREHQQFIHEKPDYTHSLYATDFKHTFQHHRKPSTEEKELAMHSKIDRTQNIDFSETAREIRENMGVKLNMTPFSGKEPVPRNEASFEEFKLEFDTVRNIYSEPVLKQGLRKSPRDQAKKVMLHLGANSTVDQIMKNLEETFGNIASEDSLLSKFLLAEQMNEETIVEWSLRLEELILQVERKSVLHTEERKALLKKRFWRGLKSEELKQATRVHFESPMSYEELRNKIRAEEYEIQIQKERNNVKTKIGKSYQTTTELHETKTHELNTIMETIQNMNKKLEELTFSQQQLQQHQTESTQSQRGRGYARGNRGRGSSSTRGYNRNRLEENMDAPSNGDLN